MRLHNIKKEIIINRKAMYVRCRIHKRKDFTLNIHEPIGIINICPIRGHIRSEAREFLCQFDA